MQDNAEGGEGADEEADGNGPPQDGDQNNGSPGAAPGDGRSIEVSPSVDLNIEDSQQSGYSRDEHSQAAPTTSDSMSQGAGGDYEVVDRDVPLLDSIIHLRS